MMGICTTLHKVKNYNSKTKAEDDDDGISYILQMWLNCNIVHSSENNPNCEGEGHSHKLNVEVDQRQCNICTHSAGFVILFHGTNMVNPIVLVI